MGCCSSAPDHSEQEENDKSAVTMDTSGAEMSVDELMGMEVDDTTPLAPQPNGRARSYKQSVVNTVTFFIPPHYTLDESTVYLGGGSYGNVIKTSMKNRRGETVEVAIKKFHEPFAGSNNARRVFREIRLLQQMKHDNVIRALDIYTPDNHDNFNNVFVVTEYAGHTLHEILRNQRDNNLKVLDFDHAQFLLYQILRGLKYIHSASIMHRDLKPSNLAVTKDCDLTILDFGLARRVEKANTGLSEYVMTRWYRSPEVIYWDIGKYDKQADVWSVGCIAAELLIGRPLFPGEQQHDQYNMITDLCGGPDSALLAKIETKMDRNTRNAIEKLSEGRQRGNFSEYFKNIDRNIPDVAIDFLDKVLVLDPEVRLTVEQALEHEYMRQYHDASDEPVESREFTLDDHQNTSMEYWKRLVWEDIQAFTGDDESPPFQ